MGRSVLALLTLVACGGGGGDPMLVDAPPVVDDAPLGEDAPSDAPPAGPPATLQASGLCADAPCAVIAADVRAYRPQYELYSDGAAKRRWIYLPAGTQIDTTNMNRWVFPVGTKLWKEFTRDGVRVETRLMQKLLADETMPNAWLFVTYAWNATQDAAPLVDVGGVEDANGTPHNIPSRADCRTCHKGGPVLGFGAIQLDHARLANDPVDLQALIDEGLLTAAPSGSGTYFPLPGTATDKAALGYMHANCGHCHNTKGSANYLALDLQLDVTKRGSVAETPAYATSVNQTGTNFVDGGMTYTTIVVPKQPDRSILIRRMLSTNPAAKMPQRGTELVDPEGQTQLRAWIDAL